MTFVTYALVVVAGFVALMIGMQLFVRYKASVLKGRPVPDLGGRAGKYTQKGKPALFYFYSPSCGACASMTPAVQDLSKTNDGVFPVDVSKDMMTARKFGIMATPTVVIVKDRVIQEILIGPQPAAALAGRLA